MVEVGLPSVALPMMRLLPKELTTPPVPNDTPTVLLVIVDCPTPDYDSASRYFLPLSDAAVLLVRWQSTPRAAVAQTIDTLAALRVPATGVVFAR